MQNIEQKYHANESSMIELLTHKHKCFLIDVMENYSTFSTVRKNIYNLCNLFGNWYAKVFQCGATSEEFCWTIDNNVMILIANKSNEMK